ncbi:MAG: anti-sigma factor [Cyanobacteria bacterium J06598_1]
MTQPADDKDWTDLAAGYVLGNLTAAEAESLEQQLTQDPTLEREIIAYQESLSLLPYHLKPEIPAASLKSKLLAAASHSKPDITLPDITLERQPKLSVSDRPLTAVSDTKSTRRRWNPWPPSLSTGIAAAAIAALGLTQLQLHARSQQTIALQQQLDDTAAEVASLRSQLKETQAVTAFLGESATQIHSLTSAENTPDSTARLLAKTGEPDIVFIAQNLPQPAPEQIYRLWAIADESSAPMYCGQFRQDASGTARWRAPDAACTNSPAQLLITLDAPDDPITSAGPLVMQSDV